MIALNSLLQANKDKALLNATLFLVNAERQDSAVDKMIPQRRKKGSFLCERQEEHVSVLRFHVHTEVEMLNEFN